MTDERLAHFMTKEQKEHMFDMEGPPSANIQWVCELQDEIKRLCNTPKYVQDRTRLTERVTDAEVDTARFMGFPLTSFGVEDLRRIITLRLRHERATQDRRNRRLTP
jgi:plasmid stabilization system protein ParE